ncbi:MAG TPA: Crp/Fnr family transcriptional regulator [Methylophilaceae bacterium]|nr:Crp/Fnr family transcriptional regulator [Methylophilaceae bacterium]HQR61199.1 Crp/Fnr family transcriptional regulator [Methylophilaceae bacterium]
MQHAADDLSWLSVFPDLAGLETSAKDKLRQHVRIAEAPVGAVGYREGSPCNAYVMRLAGRSRVQKISDSGREILLYRVGPGETCVLTTTCLLGHTHYPAETIIEEAVRDAVVPAPVFHQLMLESEVFRRFVLSNYGDLISDLIVLVDEVAFRRLEARLARLLVEATQNSPAITSTHQQLAAELGSAREVVSRHLKEFERKGWLSLGRGQIEVVERPALEKLAQQT